MVPNQGQLFFAKAALKAGHEFRLRLFSNDLTPSATTVVGDLTEVIGNGYAGVSLPDVTWTLDGDGDGTFGDVDFQGSGGDIVAYGYYIVADDPENPGTELLVAVTRFSTAPLTAVDGGLPIRVSPVINNNS
jgi:hypothetical protein